MTDAGTLLLVGPVTIDVIDGERRAGGGVAYAATVATAFGVRARVLTACADDANLTALEGHDVHVVRDAHTLTFGFVDGPTGRELRVLAKPEHQLSAADLPAGWQHSEALMLAPLIEGDIDVDSFTAIGGGFGQFAVLTQGLQRTVEADGHYLSGPRLFSLVRTCTTGYSFFRSTREAQSWEPADEAAILARGGSIVTTRAEQGADIAQGGDTLHVAPFPVDHAVDTTGAGDVFAAALILAMDDGIDVAGALAAAFAAASVEQLGLAPLPDRAEIMRRLVAAGRLPEHAPGERERGASR